MTSPEQGRVAWRDSWMTWPGLSVTLVLLPWQWSLRFWNDWDMTSSWSVWLGPIRVEWFANRPLFTLERASTNPEEKCRLCGAPASAEFYRYCHYHGHRAQDMADNTGGAS